MIPGVWCRSRRFDCILLVFFRWWGPLLMHDLIKHDALLWLVGFQQLWLMHFDLWSFTQWLAPSAVRCCTALLLLCFFDRAHSHFWNFYSTIPVDVVRVKSHMNCLFDPAHVEMRVTINKLCFVPKWLGYGVACSETAEVSVRASRMSRCLILSCMGLPVSPM